MNRLQYLCIEICPECHLGAEHPRCPNRQPHRYADASRPPLDDAHIVRLVRDAYRQCGFHGLVAWHYYNEPMCAWARLKPLMARIRREVPEAGFCLWTNGEQLPTDLEELNAFAQVWLSNYRRRDWGALLAACPQTKLIEPHFDARLAGTGRPTPGGCRRCLVELIVDYHGKLHLCCHDWRGRIEAGNVHDAPLPELIARWDTLVRQIASQPMDEAAPDACRRCRMKSWTLPELYPLDKAAAGTAHPKPYPHNLLPSLPAAAPSPAKPDPAPEDPPAPPRRGKAPSLVAAAYRIPEKRVRDFCRWNQTLARSVGAVAYLVVEKPYGGLPDWVVEVPYDGPEMPVFNLSAAKNCGIRRALADGAPVVVATDIDVIVPSPAWTAMATVNARTAVVPVYRMASAEDNLRSYVLAPAATGTVAMTAQNWGKVKYDERCVGYGCDDGILMDLIRRAGLRVVRAGYVHHVAHVAGTCQKEFDGRSDHWNRDSGFNPENFAGNGELHRQILRERAHR